jgi:hypothetical protein
LLAAESGQKKARKNHIPSALPQRLDHVGGAVNPVQHRLNACAAQFKLYESGIITRVFDQ